MVYLIFGKDNYLKEQFIKKIKKDFDELQIGINYILIDASNVNNIISDIETPAFGYDKKLIIAKNTSLFSKGNSFAETVAEYLKNNDTENVELIFDEESAEKNALYKTIEKVGQVKEVKELTFPELINEVIKIAKLYNVNINSANAQYFVECVGTNMSDVINEIRKLIEYAGPRKWNKKGRHRRINNKKDWKHNIWSDWQSWKKECGKGH